MLLGMSLMQKAGEHILSFTSTWRFLTGADAFETLFAPSLPVFSQ